MGTEALGDAVTDGLGEALSEADGDALVDSDGLADGLGEAGALGESVTDGIGVLDGSSLGEGDWVSETSVSVGSAVDSSVGRLPVRADSAVVVSSTGVGVGSAVGETVAGDSSLIDGDGLLEGVLDELADGLADGLTNGLGVALAEGSTVGDVTTVGEVVGDDCGSALALSAAAGAVSVSLDSVGGLKEASSGCTGHTGGIVCGGSHATSGDWTSSVDSDIGSTSSAGSDSVSACVGAGSGDPSVTSAYSSARISTA